MGKFSPEERKALKAGLNSLFVFVDRKQTDPLYSAGGQEIPKSVLDSLCVKRLAERFGRNYRLTPAGHREAHEL